MTSIYRLAEHVYLQATPAGAFFAVTEQAADPLRLFLRRLLERAETPELSPALLSQLFADDDEERALARLFEAQNRGLVEALERPQSLAADAIGHSLLDPLQRLSSIAKALLVDASGCPLVHSGLADAEAETLAALSTDLINLQLRHALRLQQNLGLAAQGWGALDAFGSSRVAVWPVFIGSRQFSLVVVGEPRLNQPAFVTLVWRLISRYGNWSHL